MNMLGRFTLDGMKVLEPLKSRFCEVRLSKDKICFRQEADQLLEVAFSKVTSYEYTDLINNLQTQRVSLNYLLVKKSVAVLGRLGMQQINFLIRKKENEVTRMRVLSNSGYITVMIQFEVDVLPTEIPETVPSKIIKNEVKKSDGINSSKIIEPSTLLDITGEKRVNVVPTLEKNSISRIKHTTQGNTATISSNFKFMLSDHTKNLESEKNKLGNSKVEPANPNQGSSSEPISRFLKELESEKHSAQRKPPNFKVPGSDSSYLRSEPPETKSTSQKMETDRKLNNHLKQYKDYLLNNLDNK